MARPIILSNNQMLVGINRFGLVHDFYYPYVGLENHNTAKTLRHLIGVWINGRFSWLDDNNWQFTFAYEPSTLVSHITASHKELAVTLEFHDCIDHEYNALMRRITVVNNAPHEREIRLMLHQVFRISNSLNGDTAQYLPLDQAILHFKGHRNFIVKAATDDGQPFDQYSIGVWGIEGKEGTFRDAEDGELADNPVEHGSVDSVLRFRLDIAAGDRQTVHYWVTAARSREEAIELSRYFGPAHFDSRSQATCEHWQRWLHHGHSALNTLGATRRGHTEKALLLIKAHTDNQGAVIASSDTDMLNYARDAYAYCWPRDAFFALWPLLRMGHTAEAKAFFEFCTRGLQHGGFLMHKYQADAAAGSSWHPYVHDGHSELPIQEDETAVVILLVKLYHEMTGDKKLVRQLYIDLVKQMADFMVTYTDKSTGLPHPSYDLWEQKFLTTTYSTAIVYASLKAATELAELFGETDDAIRWQTTAEDMRLAAHRTFFNPDTNYFYKGLLISDGDTQYDSTIDLSSFYGAFMMGLYEPNDPQLLQAAATLERVFKVDAKNFRGIGRYEHDAYYSSDPSSIGNPWFVCSLWVAQYYIASGRNEDAERIIQWVEKLMLPTGVLSEQISPADQSFLSVAPLVWSEAEYVNTVLDLQAAQEAAGHRKTATSPRATHWCGKKPNKPSAGSKKLAAVASPAKE
ncbi:MAG TPA: glycoside hydrolase family 15 protein [Candidatus Saccharimonadales bacterium]|nr:glycoside hydrolase family 15 protein [Candidatus Saccharimonadales bacterium]